MSHLNDVEENYFVHGATALFYCLSLLALGVAALIHAFIPHIFVHTVSDGVKKLFIRMEKRRLGENPSPGLTD